MARFFLQAAVDALLVKREELTLFRPKGEHVCGGEGGVDLFVIKAELAVVLIEAEGEEVVLDGARSVQAPTVGGDALGELGLHGAFGREVCYESFGELVVGGAVLVSHCGDLAGQAVTERVHAGAVVAGFRFCPLTRSACRCFRISGIMPDRFTVLGVVAIRFELLFRNHLGCPVAGCRLLTTTRGGEIARGGSVIGSGIGAGVRQRLGMREFWIYFRET
jgi:hypothetical protein